MKKYKEVIKMQNKRRQRAKEAASGQPDQLAVENGIRRRFATNWPTVILGLSTRVQNVNQVWGHIMQMIMMVEGLRVTYAREGEDLVLTVSWNDQVEQHKLSADEFVKAADHIEVLIMDKLKKSQLMMKAMASR